MILRNRSADSPPPQKTIQKKWAALRKKRFFGVCFQYARKKANVKEPKDVGEQNIRLEQTKQI